MIFLIYHVNKMSETFQLLRVQHNFHCLFYLTDSAERNDN